MANTFTEALTKAGLVTTEPEFKAYQNFSEFKLPFGSATTEKDRAVYTEFPQGLIDSANYIRKTAESITADEIDKLCPTIKKNDRYKNWLMKHADQVKRINKGTYHKVNNGYLGEHTEDWEYKQDTPYGFTDVIFYFQFNYQTMQVELVYNGSAFNTYYQNAYRNKVIEITNDPIPCSLEDESLKYKAFLSLVDEFEFVPFYVSEYDGVSISHKKYKDKLGLSHDAFTSPCLGINIKKSQYVMDGLANWFASGKKMHDNVFYLICENRKTEELYLARYTKWDPVN